MRANESFATGVGPSNKRVLLEFLLNKRIIIILFDSIFPENIINFRFPFLFLNINLKYLHMFYPFPMNLHIQNPLPNRKHT